MFLFLSLALLSLVFPKEGILLNSSLKAYFPDLNTLFGAHTQNKDVAKLIESVENIDTLFKIEEPAKSSEKENIAELRLDTAVVEPNKSKTEASETINENGHTSSHLMTTIQTNNPSVLKRFFEALYELKTNPKSIRVLHYGDSQIEGDRITDYLRLKLQGQFGGQGPGLITLMPVTPSVINKVTTSKNWNYYHLFTSKDKRVSHTNYGVLAGFNRFAPYKKIVDTTSVITSSFVITTTKLGGTNALGYKKLKLFYGGAQKRTWCEFYDGPALVSADSLQAGGVFHSQEYSVGNGSNTHTFKFKGKDSPDIYGVSLESDQGVMVDNVAMRGSSGTFFHQINNSQLKEFYDYLNVKLIILQFGGNSLPAINNPQMAENYASYIRYQLSVLKKIAPKASILFIGPSDMSIKVGTEYVTYPYLEAMRNALRRVVLESGCAFYDMYDGMGGKNSMPVWVNERMASKDYTHFSPQGARKIATLLYSELIKEYNNFLRSKN
jgi:lysophospholipase L1-like esterase